MCIRDSNNTDGDPAKNFPKAVIFAAIMVVVCAIFGTIAMGMMFDPNIINESPQQFDSYLSNGAYWSFQKLGEYYGVGNTFLIIYAVANLIGQLSTLLLSIDAPLRMLLDDENTKRYIPKSLLKRNKHGAFVNGIWMIVTVSYTHLTLPTNREV